MLTSPSYAQRHSFATREKTRRMTAIDFTLYGTPVSKGRPRFTRQGRTYTDAKTRDAETAVLAAWLNEVGKREPHVGAVTVDIVATFAPAPSWPKWKRELALAGDLPHTQKPDVDNLLKIIDGLNGRAWIDDSQITRANVTKQFGEIASTRFTITFHPTNTR